MTFETRRIFYSYTGRELLLFARYWSSLSVEQKRAFRFSPFCFINAPAFITLIRRGRIYFRADRTVIIVIRSLVFPLLTSSVSKTEL